MSSRASATPDLFRVVAGDGIPATATVLHAHDLGTLRGLAKVRVQLAVDVDGTVAARTVTTLIDRERLARLEGATVDVMVDRSDPAVFTVRWETLREAPPGGLLTGRKDVAGKVARWAAVVAGAIFALEVALQVVWSRLDDNDPVPTLEAQLAILAALVLLALPHALAVLGYRGRAGLLKVAGTVALALGIATLLPLTTAVVGIPLLLVPAFFYLVAARGTGPGGRIPTPALAAVAALCALGAAAAFFMTEDPRCRVERREPGGETSSHAIGCDLAGGTGRLGAREVSWSGTSDVVTFHESLPSLALSVGAFAFCAWGSAPRRRHGSA